MQEESRLVDKTITSYGGRSTIGLKRCHSSLDPAPSDIGHPSFLVYSRVATSIRPIEQSNTMSSAPTAAQLRTLYQNTLAASQRFASYNFSSYFARRAKQTFEPYLSSEDKSSNVKPEELANFYQQKTQELEVLRRSAEVNRMYEGPKLVVEHALPITCAFREATGLSCSFYILTVSPVSQPAVEMERKLPHKVIELFSRQRYRSVSKSCIHELHSIMGWAGR